MLTLYIGLELNSLCRLCAGQLHPNRRSARPKRVSNISCSARLASGMLLFGMSLLYGFAGTTSFCGDPARRFESGDLSTGRT
jgi:NADH-quinone oxidoreductase subunit N